MKFKHLVVGFLMSSCLNSSPTGVEYSSEIYNASMYLVWTNDPNWSKAVLISSDTPLESKNDTITILRNSKFPKNRVVFSVDMVESIFGFTSTELVKREHGVEYRKSSVGKIQKLEYPYVHFDIGTFHYYDFINDYRSTPPYGVGDSVRFVSTSDTLDTIWE